MLLLELTDFVIDGTSVSGNGKEMGVPVNNDERVANFELEETGLDSTFFCL